MIDLPLMYIILNDQTFKKNIILIFEFQIVRQINTQKYSSTICTNEKKYTQK